jgi:hypothetical protein
LWKLKQVLFNYVHQYLIIRNNSHPSLKMLSCPSWPEKEEEKEEEVWSRRPEYSVQNAMLGRLSADT